VRQQLQDDPGAALKRELDQRLEAARQAVLFYSVALADYADATAAQPFGTPRPVVPAEYLSWYDAVKAFREAVFRRELLK
jgi:hypothetical protein